MTPAWLCVTPDCSGYEGKCWIGHFRQSVEVSNRLQFYDRVRPLALVLNKNNDTLTEKELIIAYSLCSYVQCKCIQSVTDDECMAVECCENVNSNVNVVVSV